jgi:aminoglycoside phosphotransferase family enzyme
LDDKVYIYDCIEFNQRFRYCDIASDVAFLAMDLDFHGLEDLSHYFISRFQELSGDKQLVKMLDFYKCYRAYVRGKIGLFTASDPAVDGSIRKSCEKAAGKYFDLAYHYAESDSK